jgi:uncharacterized membrane protein YfcA
MEAGGTGPGRRAALLALGFLAGFSSALFGIGGGLVMVPALTLFFHVPIKRAVGTSLAAIILVSATGVAAQLADEPQNVRLVPALALVAGSVLGAQLGARAVAWLPARALSRLFACFIILAALKMLGLILGGTASGTLVLDRPGGIEILLLLGIGCGAGVTSSLFGIGGGLVIVPALKFLSADIPLHAAIATSLLTIVPTSIVGTFLHRRLDQVDLAIARLMVPLAFVGSVAGVLVANRTGEITLSRVFGAFLLVAAAWMLLRRDERA